jgi:hypothetical protein
MVEKTFIGDNKRMKNILILIIILIPIGYCIWAPWVTPEFALNSLQKANTQEIANPPEGKKACTLKSMFKYEKAVFGANVIARYECPDSLEPSYRVYFISLIGSAYQKIEPKKEKPKTVEQLLKENFDN